ncbi:MAG: hypothetical protein OXI71_00150 [Gemmatimonadota bacterium]|nr:hypothetical protein [Gemmatimonadota bacterium]
MTHWVDPARIRGRMRSLTGIAVALSVLVVSVAEASHSHEGEAESAAECPVCQVGKTPSHTFGSSMPGLTVSNLFRAPAIAGHGPAPAALHVSPHRSRAPPLFVSL